jgi:CBS domain-containing protein
MKQQTEERHLKVGDFMSSPVVTVRPDTNFVDAVQMMILKGIGNLAVAEGEKVAGIITERELLQHLALNKTVPNKQVRYVLTQKFMKITPETSILEAAKTMISKKARLLVFRKDRRTGADQLAGIITASDIVRAFLQTDRNPSIESAMTNRIFTLRPGSTILAAAKMMLKKGIGSVIVTANGSPYAIFTERDLLNRVLGEHVDIEDKVGTYCTHPVVTARLGIGAKDAAKIMFLHKIKRLPLTKGGKAVAMVTARDLVEAFQRGG